MPTSPPRRAVLAALAVCGTTVVTGCSTPWGELRVQPLGGDPPPPTPAPDPDELACRRAVEQVRGVLAALDTTPVDADVDAVLRAALGEQLVALGALATSAPATSSAPASSAPGSSAPASSAPAGSPSSGGPTSVPLFVAVVALRDASQATRTGLDAVAGGTARLLACTSAGLDLASSWAQTDLGALPGGGGRGTASPTASSTSSPTASSTSNPPSSPTPAAGYGEQEALVAALAVEEQARYGYGVLAVRLADQQRDAAVGDLAAHGVTVERLRDRLLVLGAQPPQAQPAWALPTPVTDAAAAVALAVQLESAAAAAAADLVAASPRERRAEDADDLVEAAQRWQRWRELAGVQQRDGLVALPGLTGR